MPTYNDSRYTYDSSAPSLQYNGRLIAPALTGNQAAPTAGLTDLDHYHQTLLGNQPAIIDVHYNEPGITYNEPVYTYEFKEAGFISFHLNAFRTLLGNQPYPTGEFSWRWAPYIWALYQTSITGRVAGTQYNARVATQDTEVRYRPEVSEEHDDPNQEIVYREHAPRPYTKLNEPS
jgi:hypothetical protein